MDQTYTATADDGPPPRPNGKRPLAPPPQDKVAGAYVLQDGILQGDQLQLKVEPPPGPGRPRTLLWMAPNGTWQHFSALWPRKGWHRIDNGTHWWRVTHTHDGIRIDGPHVMHRTRTAMPSWSAPTSTPAPRQGGTGYSSVPPVAKTATRSTSAPTLFEPEP